MKFNAVRITPRGVYENEGKWLIETWEIPGDRVDEGHGPHPAGFYYYPRSMNALKAFHALKDVMIKAHQVEIDRLTKSRNELIGLEMK